MFSLLTHRRPQLFWVLTALAALLVAWATAHAAPSLRPAAPRHPARLATVLTRPAVPARSSHHIRAEAQGVTGRISARAGQAAPQAASNGLPFILHSFDGTTNDGSNPDAGPLLYVPSLNTVFGTTTGSSGTAQSTTGTIFSFGPGGSAPFQTLATSVGLLNNGLAFGTDSNGAASLFGTNGNGTTPYGEVFGIRLSDNTVSTVRVFDDQQPQFPVAPQAGLVAAPDGYLYGTTRYEYDPSGNYDTTTFGVLYRLKPSDPNGTFEIIHRFSDGSEGHPMKGALPCVTSSGVIYGVTTRAGFVNGPGGSTFQPGEGAIYKYDPATGQFAFVAALDDTTVGTLNFSQAGLVQAGDGFLYGTTDSGGAIGDGTVYRFNPADNSVSVQYQFDDNPVGYAATAGLTVGADGNLYGTTTLAYNDNGFFTGTVFRLRPDSSGNYTQTDVLHSFAPNNGGTDFGEGLCRDAMIEVNHILYGVCNQGGASNDGLIFQVSEALAPTAPAPTITPPVGYQRNSDGTAKITINGTGFVQGCSITVSNVVTGTTLAATFVSASQLTADLSKALPGGDHTVTVTNPDGQFATATLTTPSGPTITPPIEYMAHPDGSSTVTINGSGFQAGCAIALSNIYDDSNPQFHYISSTQLTADLADILPPGSQTVTVTNPDGQKATATFTVAARPTITPPMGYQKNADSSSTVTINGAGFQAGCTVNVTSVASGTTLTAHFVSATQLTVALSLALPAGDHTITVTNPDGQFAKATLTVAGPPTITPPIGYQKNGDGTATLTINGAGFQAFCAVTVSPSPAGATYPVQEFSTTQLSVQSPVLSPGVYTVTVSNPDGQSASATLTIAQAPAPHISHLSYAAHANGASTLSITGSDFQSGLSTRVSNVTSGTTLASHFVSEAQVTVDLSTILPVGNHTVTVTNPDGQSASSTLITYGKPRVDGAVAIAQQGGDVYLVVSGAGFQPGGLNGDIGGATLFIRGPHGEAYNGARLLGGPGIPANIGSDPQQYIVDLGHPANSLNYSVEVVNPDGETSDPAAVSTRVQPRASSPPTRFNVYTSNHTEYQVSWFEQVLKFLHLSFLLSPSSNASPTQLLPGNVSLLHNQPCLITPTGPGSIAMGLIGQDGNGIVAQGGGNALPVTGLLGPVGAAAARPGQEDIVAQGGGNLVNTNGSNIVGQGGGNIVGQGGGNLIGQDGNGLIGQDGNGLIGQDGNGIVAQGGGNFTGRLRPADLSATPSVSFTLGHFDEGVENGTGPTDAQVIGTGPDGSDVLILSVRFTPGQPDVITYAAPGLVLTPTNGTSAPQVMNPTPTLTQISPTSATAGSGDTTLTVTGTLFTGSSVVNWNGQPLATTVITGTQMTAVVPAALLAASGTAQITVTNPAPGGGASNALPFTVVAPLPPANATILHTFPAGLQMFCAPEDFSGIANDTALGTPGVKLAVWDPALAQYALSPTPPADALRLGQGYWAHFAGDTPLYDLGRPAPANAPFAIALQPGWNMIGDPFPAAVPLDDLTVVDAGGREYTLGIANRLGLVSRTLYGFPAGATAYQALSGAGDALAPYQGYWIHAVQACTLRVSPTHISR